MIYYFIGYYFCQILIYLFIILRLDNIVGIKRYIEIENILILEVTSVIPGKDVYMQLFLMIMAIKSATGL